MASYLDKDGLTAVWAKAKDAFAVKTHTHAIEDVTNLQTTLNGKQAKLTISTGLTINGTTLSTNSNVAYLQNSSTSVADFQRCGSSAKAMKVRRGTFSINTTNGTKTYTKTITFSSGIGSTDYVVFVSRATTSTTTRGYNTYLPQIWNKTASGFTFFVEYYSGPNTRNDNTEKFDYVAIRTL